MSIFHSLENSYEDSGRKGTEKADLRARRIIAYTLLCGYPPFRSDDRNGLLQEMTRGRIMFHDRYWSKVSRTGKCTPRFID